jgi:phage baseplate assembly protein W
MATINRKVRQFSDLDLLFTANPYTGDVSKRNDEEAVKASIRNLILTRNFERPFHPEIGCQLHYLLFENFDPVIRNVMIQTISDMISKFEPRAIIDDIILNTYDERNELEVTIRFRILNNPSPITIKTLISRVR